jgi:hypothetical protein
MTTTVDALAQLLAIEEIKLLKSRYFRCLDTKDWAGFEQIFSADAVMDMRGEMRDGTTPGEGLTEGAAAIAAFVRGAVDHVTTVHHGHTPEITLTGADTATGIWAMEDKLRWPEGYPLAGMHGYGHYHERYVKTADGWRIAHLRLSRLRVDVW